MKEPAISGPPNVPASVLDTESTIFNLSFKKEIYEIIDFFDTFVQVS